MNTARQRKLEAAGWKVGDASDFLGLSRQEAELVSLKLALGESLRRQRQRLKLTQQTLADRLGSSQSRVAKLETGSRGVSLDLMIRALFATGMTTTDIAREFRTRKRSAA